MGLQFPLQCVLDESGTDEAECSGRRVTCSIRSLSKARSLRLECSMVSHESLLVPVLAYDSETMMWREEERSRIGVVQMDNLRGRLGIKRMDKVLNSRIRQLCRVLKVFSDGLALWRRWRMTGLVRGSL